jgi:hypothetical protein
MSGKGMMWLVITIVSSIFFWLGSVLFGGGLFGLWDNVLGTIGAFVGLWFWFKFMRDM